MGNDKTQPQILIIDDDEPVRNMLNRMLSRHGYICTLASDAGEAGTHLKDNFFDLILCDVKMPGESGLDFIRHTLADYPELATIMVSGMEDPELAEKALEMGVYGYMVKPFKPSEVIINVSSALRRQKLEIESRIYRENLEQMVANRTAKLQETLEGLIQVVSMIIESRDPYTAGHQRRVAELASAIAKEMRCPEEQVKGIHMGGLIHDLGKISVPSEILSKPSRLSEIEFELIKTHPKVGYDILKGVDFPWPIAEIAYQHHERINGSGYPRGLKGEEILLEARIIAVADTVEAMASHRPYRSALGIDAALDEISTKKGLLYDAGVAEFCVEIFSKKGFSFIDQDDGG